MTAPIRAVVVVVAATLAGVIYDAASSRRHPLPLMELAHSPPAGVTAPPPEPGAGGAFDLSAVRALPPAGSGTGAAPETADPVGLAIPSLRVDGAPVVPVGLDAAGGLQIPGTHEVGWYRFGARPGAGAGSIVLAGHVAYDGVDGVFRHLASLEPGDRATVTSGDGRQLVYEVDRVAVHLKADLPIDDLFNPSSPERLVLITCGGAFDPEVGHYASNIVVIAIPPAR